MQSTFSYESSLAKTEGMCMNMQHVSVCLPIQTISFDFQGSSDQGEQGGIEGHRTVSVEGHVHGHQPLPTADRSKVREEKINRENTPNDSVYACLYLAGHTMRTELSKSKRRLDPPEQSHYIQVLYTTPGKQHTFEDVSGLNILKKEKLIVLLGFWVVL